ncbi:hypothetical protein D3C80_2036230 [compost metagenome]
MGDLVTYFWIAVAAIILLVDPLAIVSVIRSKARREASPFWLKDGLTTRDCVT